MVDEQHWLFAYGSNMHLADVRRWCAARAFPPPTIFEARAGRLDDFSLTWNYYSSARQGAAANVAPAMGHQVFGALLLVNARTLAHFDAKEGHPQRYSRGAATRPVACLAGGTVAAWVYQVQPAYRLAEPAAPTRAYLQLLIDGARDFALPAAYRAKLDQVECRCGDRPTVPERG